MFGYYLNLAVRSFKRNKALTALMVLAIALGIGASMTTLTVFHVLSGDPIPAKSDRLFYVQLDTESMRGYRPGEEPARQMTRFDSETLLKQKRGFRQTLTSGGNVVISSDKPGTTPPPHTRSNSVTPVTRRGGSGESDFSVSNCSPRVRLVAAGFRAPGGAERLSSTIQFHCPQAPHCPDHLPCTAPQD